MRLLLITQKVDKNDSVLGFFHRWIELLAQRCENIIVICLYQGESSLPPNVRVLSLGKERGGGRSRYVLNFFKYLWRERKNYDSVFVHMNPEYVVLAGWWWRWRKQRVVLWYVHRQVTWYLRIAARFVHTILTVAPESCRLISPKVQVVGHGIDTEYFNCLNTPRLDRPFTIISVGRITRIKNLEVLIRAAGELRKIISVPFRVILVGSPVTVNDAVYQQELERVRSESQTTDTVFFQPAVPYREIRDWYCQSDLSVNLAPTGGLDKAVLESMACGVPVLVANQAFKPFLKGFEDDLIFLNRDGVDLANKIHSLFNRRELFLKIGFALREQIQKHHSLNNLIAKIITSYAE